MKSPRMVKVFDAQNRFLSQCTPKRAHQLVARKKAIWGDHSNLILLITKKEERLIRNEVRLRDNSACYICGEYLADNEITFDHIIPRSQKGTDFADNLAVCCRPCNEDKADKSYIQYALQLYFSIIKYKNFR